MAAIIKFVLIWVAVAFAFAQLLVIYESTKAGGYKKGCERGIIVFSLVAAVLPTTRTFLGFQQSPLDAGTFGVRIDSLGADGEHFCATNALHGRTGEQGSKADAVSSLALHVGDESFS